MCNKKTMSNLFEYDSNNLNFTKIYKLYFEKFGTDITPEIFIDIKNKINEIYYGENKIFAEAFILYLKRKVNILDETNTKKNV